MIEFCYPEFFKQPQLIIENIKDSKAATFCYLVILEANDDPFTVQDRFEKRIIDTVFDTSRVELIGKLEEK